MDKRNASNDYKEKKPNDKIMDNIWKLMKYTQGENNQNKIMKLYMPVFILIETLDSEKEAKEDVELELEIKLLITLPPEYQFDPKDSTKEIPEPPVPNDASISFETIEEFKCYVRYIKIKKC